MPFYFAYGANLDTTAMHGRCRGARVVGPARLINFRFFIMRDGVASVRHQPGAIVHGLLWALQLADVAPLDRFEEVAEGLYTKRIEPVLRPVGSARAFLYVGHTTQAGHPLPEYLETVVAAAASLGLPNSYVRSIAALKRPGTQGPIPPAPHRRPRRVISLPSAGIPCRTEDRLERGSQRHV